jgi:hypothetical protein
VYLARILQSHTITAATHVDSTLTHMHLMRTIQTTHWLNHINTFLRLALRLAAFYDEHGKDPSSPILKASAARGVMVRRLHEDTPPSVILHIVDYCNCFHFGSATSFMEVLLKIPIVEARWSGYRSKHGVSAKQVDYEKSYRHFIDHNFKVFRHMLSHHLMRRLCVSVCATTTTTTTTTTMRFVRLLQACEASVPQDAEVRFAGCAQG